MGKNQLKNQYQEFNFNLIDFFSFIDPSKTNKYTEFLAKMYKRSISERSLYGETSNKKNVEESEIREIYKEIMKTSEFEKYIYRFIFDTLNKENVETLWDFHNHVENHRITDTDISNYSNFDELKQIVSLKNMEQREKQLKAEVFEIHRDDTWLILKPLSFQASLTYGSATKWCTAMKNDSHYFYDYSSRGSLIYLINRKTNYKVAMFVEYTTNHGGSPHVLSFWDCCDNRIDSIEVDAPQEIMSILKKELTGPKIENAKLFSIDEFNRGYNKSRERKRATEPQPLVDAGVTFEADEFEIEDEDNGIVEVEPRIFHIDEPRAENLANAMMGYNQANPAILEALEQDVEFEGEGEDQSEFEQGNDPIPDEIFVRDDRPGHFNL